jgi:hypothetical protein
MFKNLLLIICLSSIFACSNLSKNVVHEGTLPIRNGVFADKTWNENLIFNRYSWSHELNLQFEILIAKYFPQSSFNFWFSKDELNSFNSCTDGRIVLVYSLDTKLISYAKIYDEFEKNGFTRFELVEFKKQLIQHPDSVMNSLKLYHLFGICRKSNALESIKINIPGYLEKNLN